MAALADGSTNEPSLGPLSLTSCRLVADKHLSKSATCSHDIRYTMNRSDR